MINLSKPSWGVSFSVKYAQEMNLDWQETFLALKDDMGVRRFRLMSYWDEIEAVKGTFDFSDLDWQVAECKKTDTKITLCLGLRQPRYPECHPPEWAKGLMANDLYEAMKPFLTAVVDRYKDVVQIETWQLENEALNHGIGTCTDYSRKRLKDEYKLVKTLDPSRQIIMSTSNNFGVPFFGPIPDLVGFSIYRSQYDYKNQKYTYSWLPAFYYRMRAWAVRIYPFRPSLIHELQCEPWGPKATVDLTDAQQAKSMNPERFKDVIAFSTKTGLKYSDMWGGEWWYWRKTVRNDDAMWKAASAVFKSES